METVSFKYIELVSPLLGTAESSSFFTHLLTFQFVLWELCTLKVRQLLIHLLRMEDSSLGISVLCHALYLLAAFCWFLYPVSTRMHTVAFMCNAIQKIYIHKWSSFELKEQNLFLAINSFNLGQPISYGHVSSRYLIV